MKIKSNVYKNRNLPKDYEVEGQIKSKPVMAMIFLMLVGVVLLFQERYLVVGVILLVIALFSLFFSKNEVVIEFTSKFMIFHSQENREESYLLYYDDISKYEYKHRFFDADLIRFKLKDSKWLEFRLLDRKMMMKFLNKYVHVEG